ncbi:hypothetical protein VMCG_02223 [Cytospora schulzeri]|uniref:Uncharacterized protein n=1 Tax=Cytospora schulzeri TaxID=448051 RepID=A0A423X0Y9_9PEZI|nr:hypothetical protein VMCG_02223 [Valsa malicola]
MEDQGPGVLPPPATLEPISRPSSTSTTASQTQQLPGISSIAAAAAAAAAATSSPQLSDECTSASTISISICDVFNTNISSGCDKWWPWR